VGGGWGRGGVGGGGGVGWCGGGANRARCQHRSAQQWLATEGVALQRKRRQRWFYKRRRYAQEEVRGGGLPFQQNELWRPLNAKRTTYPRVAVFSPAPVRTWHGDRSGKSSLNRVYNACWNRQRPEKRQQDGAVVTPSSKYSVASASHVQRRL